MSFQVVIIFLNNALLLLKYIENGIFINIYLIIHILIDQNYIMY